MAQTPTAPLSTPDASTAASRPASARPAVHKHFHRIAWLAVALAMCVIVFGAFVRLSNAGLSCPDWPTCYGQAAWPQAAHEGADHAATAIRPVEPHKAWREQLHRHLAASLGVLVLVLAALAARRRRFGLAQVFAAAALVGASIPLYMQAQYVVAAVLAGLGVGLLLVAALRWSNADLARTAAITLAVIVFQALLGMWTVTWLLKPIVVMGHLLGGMLMLGLLTWMAWRATHLPIRLAGADTLRLLLGVGLALLALQIALGGWVSANYAALACGTDFPKCVDQWWPAGADFREGFVLWRGIGVDYEGGVLDGESRIAIQLAHRIVAVLVFGHLFAVGVKLVRTPGLKGWGSMLLLAVLVQVALGIANVKLGLPLLVAVAHNAGAALLLFLLVSLLARLRAPEA
jgi:cytochrome c oxidase assembly protein subunit 15